MSEESKLVASPRAAAGSAASRRLRKEGWLPAIVKTEDNECRPIRLSCHDFELMLHRHMSENLILDLAVEGDNARKVLLKEVQHDPLTGKPLHADFLEISMTRKMRVPVTITLVGEPVGVTQDDGLLEHMLRELEVECLPTDLIEEIEADVSAMQIGDTLQVSDLQVGPKLTVVTPGDMAVASVLAPRMVEEEEAAEEAAEGAEPEVIGEAKEEEESTAEEGSEEEEESRK